MKKILILLLALIPFVAYNQCNLTNATDCDCLDGSSDCDLLPDILGSEALLNDASNNPEYEGWMGVSVGTPNLGHGPLRVLPTDNYICGGDTIYSPGGLDECPDGSDPQQIIKQRIYHKNGSTMTYWDRDAGTMTYHPMHGHFHVDDWGVYSLRKEIEGVDNPLDWPIIGEGAKLGFCLMDYGTCTGYGGYCVNDLGEVVTLPGAPNPGLGGGSYSCGINDQGISCGYLDIYYDYLEGMQIYFPDDICNGPYKLVVEIDPLNHFLEESDDNNVIVADIWLTEQFDAISIDVAGGDLTLCEGESVELSVDYPGAISYTWSNGDTGPTIVVTEAGTYYCMVEVNTTNCSVTYSETITIETIDNTAPIAADDYEICSGTSTTLEVTASGDVNWYDAMVGGTLLASGNTYTTEILNSSTSFYSDNTILVAGYALPHDHTGGSNYSENSYDGFLVFDVLSEFLLKSVKVYTDVAGDRTIELRDSDDNVLQSAVVNIPEGESRTILNFSIAPGTDYVLGTNVDANLDEFGYEGPRLKRSSGDMDYPFDVGSLAAITESSFEDRYYYFYDWEYESNATCTSTRTEVAVAVENCVSVDEIVLNAFEVNPNPTSGIIVVGLDINKGDDINLTITNTIGQTVYSKDIENAQSSEVVDLSNLSSGLYFILLTVDETIFSKQLILE